MMVQTAKRKSLEKPTDELWGFAFGCEGLCDPHEAMHLTGIKSKHSLNRSAREGLIRRGKAPNGHNNVYCRRSISEYIKRCAANEV